VQPESDPALSLSWSLTMTARVLVFIAGVVGLLACNSTEPSLDSLTLVTDNASYTPPSTIKVTLTNASSEAVGTGMCAELQRHDGDTWVAVNQAVPCSPDVRQVQSGETMTSFIDVPAGTPAGEYRAVKGVFGPVTIPAITTQPFTIH
jgi:hypothetical protein